MIKYFSLFSGIGAFEKALVNQGIPFELVGYSEIDKYASKSYSEIHGVSESMNFGDITKIDETKLPEIDFITYGFPCQDISLAGKQKGLLNEDGTKTRSGLFFDALRIIEYTQPKVAIAENVKNLVGTKFAEQFAIVLQGLEDAGYNNYWKVLNAKDFGIPQNRERVFIVSIRKDVDNARFQFPEPYELKIRLKDILEDVVDEKFYLSDDRLNIIKNNLGNVFDDNFVIGSSQKNTFVGDGSICPSLTNAMGTGGGQVPMVKNVGNVNPSGKGMNGTVIDAEGIARTVTIEKGEGQKVLVKTDVIRQVCNVHPTATRANPNQGRVYDPEYISPALNCCGGGNLEPHVIQKYRIRKLTPKECFRLMGFYDEDFEKCSCSNTQLYKQAGNSIVVDVAEELLCMMFDEEGNFFV